MPDLLTPIDVQIHSLWAKSPHNGFETVSLYEHMLSSAQIAGEIGRIWTPGSLRELLEPDCKGVHFEDLFIFLACAHDLGKASPIFQCKQNPYIPSDLRENIEDAGFICPKISGKDWNSPHHSVVSQAILERHGIDRSVAVILGGHHGRFPDIDDDNTVIIGSKEQRAGFADPNSMWKSAQEGLFRLALSISGLDIDALYKIKLTPVQQMLYTGLVIMADWLASDEKADPSAILSEISQWSVSDIDYSKTPFDFKFRFQSNFEPNSVQTETINAVLACNEPGIFIIEAPMGCGKTEAALSAAELLASKKGCGGVYFALPTQATADGIFPRFLKWIRNFSAEEKHSLFLAHGKSAFNKQYTELRKFHGVSSYEKDGESDGGVYASDWFSGRKKGLLSDFAIGTVDQLLMCALRQKHAALRHLGLSGKVIIIDEVHAYDAYMDVYLFRALRWLGEYGSPVIVLSATLPPDTRRELIANYLDKKFPKSKLIGSGFKKTEVPKELPAWVKSADYPIITYTDGYDVHQIAPQVDLTRETKVAIHKIGSDAAEIGNLLETLLADGGCAGIVVNTVRRAQDLFETLSLRFGEECVMLLHSGFISLDRTQRESELLRLLGPPGNAKRPQKKIIVGTQVIEQSLDLDFDVLFTDICPMDLLIQRIGRLFRHYRKSRPAALSKPMCFVMGSDPLDDGSIAVYGKYPLLTTRYLLPETICLPQDVPALVRAAYEGDITAPEDEREVYADTKAEHEGLIECKKNRANTFLLREPTNAKPDLSGSLEFEPSDETKGEGGLAAVRDSQSAIEVILIREVSGKYRMLPWIEEGKALPIDETPDAGDAFTLAGCKVRLPSFFSMDWQISKTDRQIARTIRELEEITGPFRKAWYRSPWLNGELFLPLDEDLSVELCGKTIHYDPKIGLRMEG